MRLSDSDGELGVSRGASDPVTVGSASASSSGGNTRAGGDGHGQVDLIEELQSLVAAGAFDDDDFGLPIPAPLPTRSPSAEVVSASASRWMGGAVNAPFVDDVRVFDVRSDCPTRGAAVGTSRGSGQAVAGGGAVAIVSSDRLPTAAKSAAGRPLVQKALAQSWNLSRTDVLAARRAAPISEVQAALAAFNADAHRVRAE